MKTSEDGDRRRGTEREGKGEKKRWTTSYLFKKKKKKSDKFKDSKYKDLTLKLSLTMSNSFW